MLTLIPILLGLMLGYKENINEELEENFRNASMMHILAVSGMHVAYLILGINIFFNRIIGKRKTNFLIIAILTFYMFVTNFTPSITRAGVMGILAIQQGRMERNHVPLLCVSA